MLPVRNQTELRHFFRQVKKCHQHKPAEIHACFYKVFEDPIIQERQKQMNYGWSSDISLPYM